MIYVRIFRYHSPEYSIAGCEEPLCHLIHTYNVVGLLMRSKVSTKHNKVWSFYYEHWHANS